LPINSIKKIAVVKLYIGFSRLMALNFLCFPAVFFVEERNISILSEFNSFVTVYLGNAGLNNILAKVKTD